MNKIVRLNKDVGAARSGEFAVIISGLGDSPRSLRSLRVVGRRSPPVLAELGHLDELDLMQMRWPIRFNGTEIQAGTAVAVIERKSGSWVVQVIGRDGPVALQTVVEVHPDSLEYVDPRVAFDLEPPVAV